jgi:hypothetical protein
MTKYFTFLSFFLLFISCKTLDRLSYSKAPKIPIEQKILSLEKKGFGTEKFDNEIVDNICDAYGEKYGYIIYTEHLDSKLKGFNTTFIFGTLTLGIPFLFGMPLATIHVDAEIDYEIQNSKSERIAKFTGKGKSKVPIAMYYGYSMINGGTKAYIDAMINAHKEIQSQLTKEIVEEINKKLKEKGKL